MMKRTRVVYLITYLALLVLSFSAGYLALGPITASAEHGAEYHITDVHMHPVGPAVVHFYQGGVRTA